LIFSRETLAGANKLEEHLMRSPWVIWDMADG